MCICTALVGGYLFGISTIPIMMAFVLDVVFFSVCGLSVARDLCDAGAQSIFIFVPFFVFRYVPPVTERRRRRLPHFYRFVCAFFFSVHVPLHLC